MLELTILHNMNSANSLSIIFKCDNVCNVPLFVTIEFIINNSFFPFNNLYSSKCWACLNFELLFLDWGISKGSTLSTIRLN